MFLILCLIVLVVRGVIFLKSWFDKLYLNLGLNGFEFFFVVIIFKRLFLIDFNLSDLEMFLF